ncbi:autoinducer binding domain-containing protein [Bradyrhizobium pachyrhizi]|uniref:autoinducer binding domain-containing protein n=1 Tax=Bradyrhizobium pachyrhizi TaxID=280333 RepID=UPI003D369924
MVLRAQESPLMATIERAFEEFADGIHAAEDGRGFERVARRVAERLGFRWFAYLCQAGDVTTVISSYPRSWTRRYIERGYARLDPVVRRAAGSASVFSWDGALSLRATSSAQRRFFDEAATFGVKSGITVPVRAGFGRTVAFTLATDAPALATDALLEADGDIVQLIGLYFHAHLAAKRRSPDADRRARSLLTQRQLQCLAWAAQGKSATDIAVLVDIAPRTVIDHLEKARRKLGATTTAQCIAEALRRGLLA